MKNLLLLLALLPGLVLGQATLTSTSYLPTISLDVPTAAATSTCQPVAPTAATAPQSLSNVFIDAFATFDPAAGKWAPNYDGGYVPASKVFQGYDWASKRTEAGMGTQQTYVDAGYKGSSAAALGINPFSLASGILTITANQTPAAALPYLGNLPYTSGMITSRPSFAFKYGYVEARLKLPQVQGAFPAFWLLPKDEKQRLDGSLPELDIVEGKSNEADTVIGTSHSGTGEPAVRVSSGCRTTYANYGGAFHQYGMLWTPVKIVFYIDRVPVGQILTPADTRVPMYLIFNLAVGGNWVGNVTNAATSIPMSMGVSRVVVYTIRGPGNGNCYKDSDGAQVCIGE